MSWKFICVVIFVFSIVSHLMLVECCFKLNLLGVFGDSYTYEFISLEYLLWLGGLLVMIMSTRVIPRVVGLLLWVGYLMLSLNVQLIWYQEITSFPIRYNDENGQLHAFDLLKNNNIKAEVGMDRIVLRRIDKEKAQALLIKL